MKRSPLRAGTKPLKRTPLPPRAEPIKARKVSKRFAGLRDEAFREYVRGLPCVLIGRQRHVCDGPVECCHVRTRAAAGSDRGNCFPCCRHGHNRQHLTGIESFQKFYGLDLPALARRLEAEYLKEGCEIRQPRSMDTRKVCREGSLSSGEAQEIADAVRRALRPAVPAAPSEPKPLDAKGEVSVAAGPDGVIEVPIPGPGVFCMWGVETDVIGYGFTPRSAAPSAGLVAATPSELLAAAREPGTTTPTEPSEKAIKEALNAIEWQVLGYGPQEMQWALRAAYAVDFGGTATPTEARDDIRAWVENNPFDSCDELTDAIIARLRSPAAPTELLAAAREVCKTWPYQFMNADEPR